MKKILTLILPLMVMLFFSSCSENYSNGERVGTITSFSKNGQFFKSHEGHLNVTQTGMNSSTGFDFSIDNDNEPEGLVEKLDSAANQGWKVKLVYHEVAGFNWFGNRGHTDFFVTEVDVIDKGFAGNNITPSNINQPQINSGKVIDTIYVVIMPNDPRYKDFVK